MQKAADQKVITPRFDYSRADWIKFRDEVTSRIPDQIALTTTGELETAAKTLTTIIQESVKASVPHVRPRSPTLDLPPEILELISLRNRLRKQLIRTRNRNFKPHINQLQKLIKEKTTQFHRNRWDEKISKLSTTDHSIWKLTKSLTKPYAPTFALQSGNGLVYAPEEKANVFADSLELSFQPNQDIADRNHEIMVTENVQEALTQAPTSRPFTTKKKEIIKIIKKLKMRKSPGPDGTENVALKHLPNEALMMLKSIINAIFKLFYFPQCWKLAKVINIPKPNKDKKMPQNYRPISLLNSLGKVTERVILSKLQTFMLDNSLLIDEQFGFRGKHSTTHQLVRVAEYVTDNYNKNRSTSAVFLDIEKAFDRVWHPGLIHKLIQYKIPDTLIFLLNSYLSNRSFFVQVEDKKSTSRSIKAGVPQGSILGPYLFSIFVNDIPKHHDTNIALYADDTVVYASSTKPRQSIIHVQRHMELLQDWFTKWKIKVNVTKCEAIVFSKKHRQTQIPNVKLNNTDIPFKQEVKYLGVLLDRKLLGARHIQTQRGKANGRLAQLKSLLVSDQLHDRTKVTLYKMLIRPLLTYAAPAWAFAANTHLKKLQIFQNRVLKLISKCPRYTRMTDLHRRLNIDTIFTHIRDLTQTFYENVNAVDNNLITGLGSYQVLNRYKHRRPLHALYPNPPKHR